VKIIEKTKDILRQSGGNDEIISFLVKVARESGAFPPKNHEKLQKNRIDDNNGILYNKIGSA